MENKQTRFGIRGNMQTNKQTDFANQGDTISRQAAIYAFTHKWDGMVTSVFDVINSLPSAQPDLDSAYTEGYTSAESKYRKMWDEMQYEQQDRLREITKNEYDEWCTDCKEYDKERNSCPRWNRVIRETLKDMKEAQPEIIRCKECKHWKKTCGDESWSVGDCDVFDEKLVMCKGFCAWAERRTDE